MKFAPGGPLRRVIAYLWLARDDADAVHATEIPAMDWWDGTTVADPSRKKGECIVVKEAYRRYCEPDEVRLECGHEIPVKQRHGRKWYNLRRRCPLCAMDTMVGK